MSQTVQVCRGCGSAYDSRAGGEACPVGFEGRHDWTPSAVVVACSFCRHLHYAGNRIGYLPCPLAAEGCDCYRLGQGPQQDQP